MSEDTQPTPAAGKSFWSVIAADVARNPQRTVQIFLLCIAALTGLVAVVRGIPLTSLPAVPVISEPIPVTVADDGPRAVQGVGAARTPHFQAHHRLALHRGLRKIAANGTAEQKRQVQILLSDEDALKEFESKVEGQVVGDAPHLLSLGKLTDFFQWIIDNAPKILAFVMQVLQMFHLV